MNGKQFSIINMSDLIYGVNLSPSKKKLERLFICLLIYYEDADKPALPWSVVRIFAVRLHDIGTL